MWQDTEEEVPCEISAARAPAAQVFGPNWAPEWAVAGATCCDRLQR